MARFDKNIIDTLQGSFDSVVSWGTYRTGGLNLDVDCVSRPLPEPTELNARNGYHTNSSGTAKKYSFLHWFYHFF